MKKVVIVGGGLAGLSAGIICARNGYETVIYEKNLIPGGCCSGWKRGPYAIDNCIHWMSGTLKNTFQYDLWKELGALTDDIKLIKRDSFYSSEYEGQTATLWRDIERTRKELIEISPEDEKEIDRFINATKLGMKAQFPKDMPWDEENAFNNKNLYIDYSAFIKTMLEYVNLNLEELSKKFKHPLLQHLISDFMNSDYESYWLPLAYSIFASGDGELPEGGSMGVVKRMVETYKNAGGKLYLGKPVKKINVNKKKFSITKKIFDLKSENSYKMAKVFDQRADGITLADGTFIQADYIICACDLNFTFSNLLKKNYMPTQLKHIYKKGSKIPLYSSFQVAFSVESEMPEVDQHTFECEPLLVGTREIDRICVKNYRVYGDFIAPKGQTVIQVSIVQKPEDFEYWKKIHSLNLDLYEITKKNIADNILERIETHYPAYKGKIHLLDVWTPFTYFNRNNCYKGAYMRFITTVTSRGASIPCDIKNIRNVFLASHWLRYPGGIPTAVVMGKVAAHRIISVDNKKSILPIVKILPELQYKPKKTEKE